MRIRILCFLLASSSDLLGAQAAVSSMGTLFITSTPKLSAGTGKLSFLMATWSEELFKVSIEATWYIVQRPLKDTVSMSKTKPVDYPVLFVYINTLLAGRAWRYKLQGQNSFSLTVLMEEPGMTIESFQAVPVAGWGKRYLIFTLQECPSIQMITTVNQTLRISKSGADSRNPEVLKYPMGSDEAYSLTYRKSSPKYQSLSGAIIEGDHPFGLVSGTCADFAIRRNCTLKDLRHVLFTEMLLASTHLGTDFIGLYIPLIDDLAEFYIMANEDDTQVNIRTESSHKDVTLHIGEMHVFPGVTRFRIQTSRPVQVVLLQLTPCLETVGDSMDKGDSTLSLIIPNALFYVQYIWMTPHTSTTDYATVAIQRTAKSQLELNNVSIVTKGTTLSVTNGTWYNVPGEGDYQIINLAVPKGMNTLTTKPIARFGCYLFGRGAGVSYMHPVGFHDCIRTQGAMDDLVDNDCDGVTDEELLDELDNDGDEKIDEDTRSLQMVNGSWGPWDTWKCISGKQKHRKRLCNDPAPRDQGQDCEGSNEENSNATCKPKNGQWGVWLEWSCEDKSIHDKRQRMRKCDSPAPEDDGLDCPGKNTEDDVKRCAPVDGAWNTWTEWTCDPKTSTVVMFRKRLCNRPEPFGGGDYCEGHDNETKLGACTPIDGHWGRWTNWLCVGDKFNFKTRLCNNPAPKDGGLPCPGKQNKTKEPCNPSADNIFDGFNYFILFVPLLMLVPICILCYMIFHDRKRKKEKRKLEQLEDLAAEANEKASTSTAVRKIKSRSQESSPKSSHTKTNVGGASRNSGTSTDVSGL